MSMPCIKDAFAIDVKKAAEALICLLAAFFIGFATLRLFVGLKQKCQNYNTYVQVCSRCDASTVAPIKCRVITR